jgi:hypothetical protein
MNQKVDNASGGASKAGPIERAYEVGYGKPPTSTRFRKGQSGNPTGHKKKNARRIDDLGALLDEILEEKIKVLVGDRMRRMTRLKAMFHAQGIKAISDTSAALRWFKLANKTGLLKPAERYQCYLVFTDPDGDQARILKMYHREQAALKKAAFGIDPPSVDDDEHR